MKLFDKRQKEKGGNFMRISKKNVMKVLFTIAILVVMMPVTVLAAEETAEYAPAIYGQFWSLVPPLVAIALALITKEVYSSLIVGIAMGALLYADFSPIGALRHVYKNGVMGVLTDSYNMGILLFLVILGAIVCLMNRAGGSAAFGEWASKHVKTRVGAQLATIILGVLIFIDDYFNCLTVGSVMRPIADKNKVSRAKLSYLIDATAAPVCIIAPISSWAAAVSNSVENVTEVDINGFEVFIKAIPYNFYALFTILMMVFLVVSKREYGPMSVHEKNALKGDIFTTSDRPYGDTTEDKKEYKGKVSDLVLPIVALIVCCVIGMIYTGGFFRGVPFVDAFSGCSADVGLALGSGAAFVITIVWYLIRRVLSFKDCMDCIPEGFKAMVPAILILICAWTLNTMTQSLGSTEFVDATVSGFADSAMSFLPAIVFAIGCFIAFSTGTSWGTFGILIPIVIAVFGKTNPELMIIGISACMAGAVCGDHCSPISDTTIMASAGAQCNHVNHVSTQLPYAITVAAVSFVTYIVAGFVQNAWITLPIGAALMIGVLLVLGKKGNK